MREVAEVKISYDSKADAVNTVFQEGKYDVGEEVSEGVIVDLSKDGRIISIEILDASKRMPKESAKKVEVKRSAV